MRFTRILGMGFVLAAVVAVPAWGSPLTVDGDLSDWGLTVGDGNASIFGPSRAIGLLGFHLEDQNDTYGDSGVLGPNMGGQNYDAEYMGVAYQQGNIYMSILTGQRPDNGLARFAPGDLRIETSAGTYGLEIGGGAGGGPGDALTEGMPGSSYLLDNHGFTVAHLPTLPYQTVGSVWGGVEWLPDPINPFGPTQMVALPWSTQLGVADYIYTRDATAGSTEHSIIELSIPAAWFDGQTINSVHWRPSCGNDELNVCVDFDVPEPSSLALLVLGGLTVARRRR